LIVCLSVEQKGFNTAEGRAIRVVNPDFGDAVDIRNFISDSRDRL